ncbi:hypothetical protein MAP00_001870 [Monascus purpureus]|nr:hypothetical protein MAP00_001870 [Monascus purpureus]
MSTSNSAVPDENDNDKNFMENIALNASQDRSDAECQVEDERGQDEALEFAAHQVEISKETERNVRRKIDFHMLPWMCGLYLLQYLDKTTLSYASSMGIKRIPI